MTGKARAFTAGARGNIVVMSTNTEEPSVFRSSSISYLHIPALDARRSAEFYRAVFGWTLRGDPDHPSFTDGSGHVIGAWVTNVPVAGEAGVVPYVYVDDVDDALERAAANGATPLKQPYPEGDLWVATIHDPAGNVIGIWQHGPRRSARE
jgi:predicted enzyme related to lactoylglutathione lyase